MTPIDRLLLEAIPVRPEPAPGSPRPTEVHSLWTPDEQDQHWADLADALGIPSQPRPAHPEPGQAAA
ncbi:hypothetical protein ABZ608_41560 [Streptomyces sp. NPDC013172]|uniref:Uncharacterized protein n=1 Tax=Streptomyces atriruber TaxID=545121 RepID=A0ABV3C115_9ACTN